MQHTAHDDEYSAHAAAAAASDPLAVLHAPARVIQRAYKRFTSRRIFAYFRGLILARQNSNPYLLLKLLNPAEFASLGGGGGGDHASGLYIRFRLGGSVFPPVLYYKTFSSMPVTDIGAFAPRDYARDRKHAQHRENVHLNEKGQEDGVSVTDAGAGLHSSQLGPSDRAYWYRRYENNGWRPILHDSLLASRDETLERTSSKTTPFHPNKLVRAMDVMRKRKGRKIEWLKKLYSSGIVALPTQEELEAKRQAAQQQDEDREFDSDEEEWNAWKAASSSPSAAAAAASAGPSPSQLLANLMSLDSSSPSLLLPGPTGVPDWESEADQLLEWCSGLADFEGYANEWATKATTRPNARAYREMERPTAAAAASGAQSAAASSNAQARPAAAASSGAGSRALSAGLRDSSSASASAAAQGLALDAQLSASTLAAAAAAAAAAAEEDAENAEAGFPSWIQQTASSSRAQLEIDSARASQSNLQHSQQQSHTGSSTSRSQLSASPSQRSATSSTAAPLMATQQVHVKSAISAGQAQPTPSPKQQQQSSKRGNAAASTGALAATLNASSLTRLRG